MFSGPIMYVCMYVRQSVAIRDKANSLRFVLVLFFLGKAYLLICVIFRFLIFYFCMSKFITQMIAQKA